MSKVGVLFVCMGNICRSPTAHAVFSNIVAREGLANQILVDSCGTIGAHAGEPPDRRAKAHAKTRGYDLSPLRARMLQDRDFHKFDYVLAMDAYNLARIHARCPRKLTSKVSLFLRFTPGLEEADVPDPYYGNQDGFEEVLDLVEKGSKHLLTHLRKNHRI